MDASDILNYSLYSSKEVASEEFAGYESGKNMNPLTYRNTDEAMSKGRIHSSHINDRQNEDDRNLNSNEGESIPDLILSLTNSNENTNSKEEETAPENSNNANWVRRDIPSNEKRKSPTRHAPSNTTNENNTHLNPQSVAHSSEDDSDGISEITIPKALLDIVINNEGIGCSQYVDEESRERKIIAPFQELILKCDWECAVSSIADSFEDLNGGSDASIDVSELTFPEGVGSPDLYEPNFELIERLIKW
jgi:hypothetical protein